MQQTNLGKKTGINIPPFRAQLEHVIPDGDTTIFDGLDNSIKIDKRAKNDYRSFFVKELLNQVKSRNSISLPNSDKIRLDKSLLDFSSNEIKENVVLFENNVIDTNDLNENESAYFLMDGINPVVEVTHNSKYYKVEKITTEESNIFNVYTKLTKDDTYGLPVVTKNDQIDDNMTYKMDGIHYGFSSVVVTELPEPEPEPEPDNIDFVSDICFLKDTLVHTDQGKIKIQHIIPNHHTIQGKVIYFVSRTKTKETHIIKIKKDAINENVPSRDTYISNKHRIRYNNMNTMAHWLPDINENISRIPYQGDVLYNIGMKNHSYIKYNNMIAETINPNCEVYQMYIQRRQNLSL